MDEVKNNLSVAIAEIMVEDKRKMDKTQSETYLCNKDDLTTIINCHFWLKGIFLFLIAVTGLILNIVVGNW